MIFLGADHAGYILKEEIKNYLDEIGYQYEDLGALEFNQTDDYPDYAQKVAYHVLQSSGSRGILICGTGQGMCITANKIKGIRAVQIWDEFTARTASEHLNAQIVCLAGRVISPEMAKKIIKIWLETNFSGEPRHIRRIKKIADLED